MSALLLHPAAALERGEAVVVRPANDAAKPGAPLDAGSADTPFSLQLPGGAACSASSAESGYRVQSFIVPAGVDPTTLAFDADGPTPSGLGAALRQPLVSVSGDPFVNAQTAKGAKGDPGFVVNLPAFNFAAFGAGDIPSGAYTVGVACTKGEPGSQQLDQVWTAALTFGADGTWFTNNASTDLPVPTAAGSRTPSVRNPERVEAPAKPALPAPAVVSRNALPSTPGGTPSVNVTALEVPGRFVGAGSTLAKLSVLAAVLVALRLVALFRPRPPALER